MHITCLNLEEEVYTHTYTNIDTAILQKEIQVSPKATAGEGLKSIYQARLCISSSPLLIKGLGPFA